MVLRSFFFIFISLVALLAGCSREPDQNNPIIQDSTDSTLNDASEKDASKIKAPPDSDEGKPQSENQSPLDPTANNPEDSLTEETLMKPPGRFAGSNYDEEKVQAALDELPNDLTADQYREELLLLLAEDYRPYINTFKKFDTEVKVNNERPDGDLTLPSSRKLHISILLDASGSMNGKIDDKPKMDSAKEAIQAFADKLPENAEISLRVYGHKGSGSSKDRQLSCKSTEEIFHGQGSETNQMKTALQDIKPAGWTPIANALKSVKQDINPETTDSVVYVVSDGIETCGGDPVKVAKELNKSKVQTVVNIIGFDVDNEGQNLLRQVAASGGGEFISVDNEKSLKEYLNRAYEQLQVEWKKWKEHGQGETNTQVISKQGAINNAEMEMQILVNTEYYNLLAALKFLETKYGNDIPHGEIWMQFTKRKNFAGIYARDTGRRLYDEIAENGTQVYEDIENEGDKHIEDLEDKKK